MGIEDAGYRRYCGTDSHVGTIPTNDGAQGIFALVPRERFRETFGPGTFLMSNAELVEAQMRAAGFEDIRFEWVDAKVRMGDGVKDVIGFQLALGPAGEMVREAGELAAERDAEIRAALAELLRPHVTDEGVWMDSSPLVISARNPT